jgi:hypothetical protein
MCEVSRSDFIFYVIPSHLARGALPVGRNVVIPTGRPAAGGIRVTLVCGPMEKDGSSWQTREVAEVADPAVGAWCPIPSLASGWETRWLAALPSLSEGGSDPV